MSQKILGLDIRSDVVCAALLSAGLKGMRMEALSRVAVEEGMTQKEAVGSVLKALTDTADIKDAACMASFPAGHVSYRNLRVPFKAPKKIAQMLPFELAQMLPFETDDLSIDFFDLNRSGPGPGADIVAAAVKTSAIKTFLDMLAEFNLTPEIIVPEAYPAAACLARLGHLAEQALILDIKTPHCSFFILISKQIFLIRTVPLPVAAPDPLKRISLEIKRTISGVGELFGNAFNPAEIIISGVDLNWDAAKKVPDRIAGISVRTADLLFDMDGVHIEAEKKHWNPGVFNNAAALCILKVKGIRSINFKKNGFAGKRIWEEHKASIIRSVVLAGIALCLFAGNLFWDSHMMQRRAIDLEQQITDIFQSTFPEVRRIVDPLQQMKVKLKKIKQSLNADAGTGHAVRKVDVLNDISRKIPAQTDVELTSLIIGTDAVSITGMTDKFNSVDDMKNRLARIPYFHTVKIGSAKIDQTQNRVRFKINAEF